MQQAVLQRAVTLTRPGVHRESGRFVDDQQFVVLINHLEIDGLRDNLAVQRFHQRPHINATAALNLGLGRQDLTIHTHTLLANPVLQTSA